MLKSAYELAMERTGGAGPALSDEQKTKLAAIDARYKALIAEKEILFAERIHAARLSGDFGAADALAEELAAERAQLEERRNRDKDRCRSKEDSSG